MIVRLPRASDWVSIMGASLVLAAFLSYFSLRDAWAAYLARSQSPPGLDRAVRLEPGNAQYWYLLGHYWQYSLDQRETAQAITFYKKAVILNPYSAQAWLDLAESYEQEEDLASARDAFLRAREAHPISAEVAWRYGNFLLRQGDLSAAYEEIHRSLLAEPLRAQEAVLVCWRAAPYIYPILDKVLPPSGAVYLSAIGVLVGLQQTDAALAVWERLVSLQPRLGLGDATTLLDALLTNGKVAEAERVWAQALALAGVARPDDLPGSLIWDGSFETDVVGGFAWRTAPVRGAQISFDDRVKHSGRRSLRVHFDGTQNVAFENVCQFVVIEPGTPYRFSAWIQTDTLTTDRGVFFRLSTLESPVMTVEKNGTEPWTLVTVPLTAMRNARLLQVCLARMPSEKLDNKIAGTVWVDDVSLTRESPPVPGHREARPLFPAKKAQP